jgi:hypothetical protein
MSLQANALYLGWMFFFIKGHSSDFITFITKSQSLTTQDQPKHKERPPNRVQTRQPTTPSPPSI